MGMTDHFLVPIIPQYVARSINKMNTGDRIAWIGQRHPAMNDTNQMYKGIMEQIVIEGLEFDFYDLNNDEGIADNSYVWDVNTEWDFEEYDLVVAVRIFYACESASQLVRNVKKVTGNGKKIVGDLMSGNTARFDDNVLNPGEFRRYYSKMHGKYELFSKPPTSKAILPMLSDIWISSGVTNPLGEYDFAVQPNHDDQILTEEMFESENIKVTPVEVFREPTKYRIYSICEFSNDA